MTRGGLRTILVAPDKAALCDAAARYVAECSRAAVAARGEFVISLAGGSTPRDLYSRLAQPPFRDAIDWRRWHVLFGDERCVPPDHQDSNYRMANEALLSRVPIATAHIHRVDGENPDPRAAAASYDEFVQRELFASGAASPTIDLSLLGIGDDGHTASLFPDVIDDCVDHARHAIAVYPASKATWRVTLSLPTLQAATCTLFLVAGASKREMLERVIRGDPSLPAARVANGAAHVVFAADSAAY
jgi:6-phosphogluconolactonase